MQDFDTGSRNVPSGKHIFNHVVDSMTVGEGLPPSRPLMFGGGYRLGGAARRPSPPIHMTAGSALRKGMERTGRLPGQEEGPRRANSGARERDRGFRGAEEGSAKQQERRH